MEKFEFPQENEPSAEDRELEAEKEVRVEQDLLVDNLNEIGEILKDEKTLDKLDDARKQKIQEKVALVAGPLMMVSGLALGEVANKIFAGGNLELARFGTHLSAIATVLAGTTVAAKEYIPRILKKLGGY